jgi:dTDP-4-amino-4,6-dideoxygalactose transaminase
LEQRTLIPFNKPYITGGELENIREALDSGHLSGNGPFTKRCHDLLEKIGFGKVLLTTSCTDALEMAAILSGVGPGDEVIVPSFTFVSTALAFVRQGAKIIFADSRNDNPCIDEDKLEELISEKTRVIVPVHYNGIACRMDKIMDIAGKYGVIVVEDAAHAFGSRYCNRLLGTIGHLGCISFHETKIIQCGEGGMLCINDRNYHERAEVIWEKGTNRVKFSRGETQKYQWMDTGSSFLMSDINAAFLHDQILHIDSVINRRIHNWEQYYRNLADARLEKHIVLPEILPDCTANNAGFYIVVSTPDIREELRKYLNEKGIQAVSHYLDLGESPYIRGNCQMPRNLRPNSLKYQQRLLRLPFYYDLSEAEIKSICGLIVEFFNNMK